MNTLPKGNVDQVELENDQVKDKVMIPNVSSSDTVLAMSQPETSNDETKGLRGRPKGIRSSKVIKSEIEYKLSQIEKQTSRLGSFQDKMDVCEEKITSFQNDITNLESQLETCQD